MLHKINVSDPVLAAPSGYNVCLRVGGLDDEIDFVPKFDIIGLVGVYFLVGRDPLLSKIVIIKRDYGLSGCHREGLVCLVRPEFLLDVGSVQGGQAHAR